MRTPTVSVVTFHTNKPTWAQTPHEVGGVKPPCTQLIVGFLAAARAADPGCELVLLTDRDTVVPPGFDRVVRGDIMQNELMLTRFRMQRAFLSEHHRSCPVALLDTDTVVLRPLGEVFDGNFDVGVTIRDRPREEHEFTMPYNNGVILVDPAERTRVLGYFDELITRTAAMPSLLHAWSGNQYAVRDLLGPRQPGEVFEAGGARVKVFPCSRYNYTPDAPDEDTVDKVILHFRGRYKYLMPYYSPSSKGDVGF